MSFFSVSGKGEGKGGWLTVVHPCKSLVRSKNISYNHAILHWTYSIRGLHGDADTDAGNRTCSEECPETIGGHTG